MAHRGVWLAVALGAALRGPSCGTDAPGAGENAPCTRSSDCVDGLSCTMGTCASLDAGAPSEGGASDAKASDASHDE